MICDSPLQVRRKLDNQVFDVPCGKCPPCKQRRVASWCFRLKQEEKVHDFAHFVTFTYGTDTVPISPNGFMSLCKKDFQDFMKRLRKRVGTNVKYYACGEYGGRSKRPHYHAIVFGVSDKNCYFDAWQHGVVHIGAVSGASIAYTLKYIDKANFVRLHGRDDRVPEFSLMSKGLGDCYLSSSVVQYHAQRIDELFVTDLGGYRLAMPRYYRCKLFDMPTRFRQADVVKSIVEADVERKRIEYDSFSRSVLTFDETVTIARVNRFKKFYNVSNRNLI